MGNDTIIVLYKDRLRTIEGFYPCEDFDNTMRKLDLLFIQVDRAQERDTYARNTYAQVISACVMKLPSGEHISMRRQRKNEAPASSLSLLAAAEVRPGHIIDNPTSTLRNALGRDMVEQFTVPFPRVLKVEPMGIIANRDYENKATFDKVCFLFDVEVSEPPSAVKSPMLQTNMAVNTVEDITASTNYDLWSAIYVAHIQTANRERANECDLLTREEVV